MTDLAPSPPPPRPEAVGGPAPPPGEGAGALVEPLVVSFPGCGERTALRAGGPDPGRSGLRSLLLLGVLAGATAGFVIASLSGALRTGTALDRLREQEDAPDAVVFSGQVGVIHPDWSVLEARPEVTRVAPWGLAFGVLGPADLPASRRSPT